MLLGLFVLCLLQRSESWRVGLICDAEMHALCQAAAESIKPRANYSEEQPVVLSGQQTFAENVKILVATGISQSRELFLCPRHSKNGGGALSVTPVRAFVRPSVRPCVRPLSKFGVR